MDINLLNKVSEQVRKCQNKYGDYASQWEFMGVMAEEIDELFIELRKKKLDISKVNAELIDCLTVLIKFYHNLKENNNIIK